jgi:hypothetical protein
MKENTRLRMKRPLAIQWVSLKLFNDRADSATDAMIAPCGISAKIS